MKTADCAILAISLAVACFVVLLWRAGYANRILSLSLAGAAGALMAKEIGRLGMATFDGGGCIGSKCAVEPEKSQDDGTPVSIDPTRSQDETTAQYIARLRRLMADKTYAARLRQSLTEKTESQRAESSATSHPAAWTDEKSAGQMREGVRGEVPSFNKFMTSVAQVREAIAKRKQEEDKREESGVRLPLRALPNGDSDASVGQLFPGPDSMPQTPQISPVQSWPRPATLSPPEISLPAAAASGAPGRSQ